MILVTAYLHTEENSFSVEFEETVSTLEILQLQLYSLIDKETIIIDYAGRIIESLQDLQCLVTNNSSKYDEQLQLKKVFVWLLDRTASIENICSSRLFTSSEAVIQPSFHLKDTTFNVCVACAKHIDQSFLEPCRGNLIQYSCSGKEAADFGFFANSYEDESKGPFAKPIHLYLKRLYFESVVHFQNLSADHSAEVEQFQRRIASCCQTVQIYEDPTQQQVARSVIDLEKIQLYANEYRESISGAAEMDVCFMKGLLRWFKCDFFKWTNAPACDACKALGDAAPRKRGMHAVGMAPPTDYERNVCWAQRVELHKCKACDAVTRFPRVNNPSILLTSSRRGRCGEWANAFCLLCRTLGIDAAYCMDWTDHVWTEVWIPSLKRYVHVDSCERALDTPLVYESGMFIICWFVAFRFNEL